MPTIPNYSLISKDIQIFLQGCIDRNYKVVLWLDTPLFIPGPTPKNIDDYLMFVEKEIDFVNRSNSRINQYVQQGVQSITEPL